MAEAHGFVSGLASGATATVATLRDELVRTGAVADEMARHRLGAVLKQKQFIPIIGGNKAAVESALRDVESGQSVVAAGCVADLVRDGACHWVSRAGRPHEWTFAGGPDPRPTAAVASDGRPLKKSEIAPVGGLQGRPAPWNGLATELMGLPVRHPLTDGLGPWGVNRTGPLGLTPAFVAVSPALAFCWWLFNAKNNRDIGFMRVANYAADILNDRWYLNHQGVAFTTRGRLFDGQNRLLAIWVSRRPVVCLVSWGLHPAAMKTVDGGRTRSRGDAAAIDEKDLGNHQIAVARWMLAGPFTATRSPSTQTLIMAGTKFRSAIDFAMSSVNSRSDGVRGLSVAPVHAALARAWLAHPARRGELVRFAKLLNEDHGAYNKLAGADHTPLSLRRTLLSLTSCSNSGRTISSYQLTQTALVAFLGGVNLAEPVAPTPTDEMPLPSGATSGLGLRPKLSAAQSAVDIWQSPGR